MIPLLLAALLQDDAKLRQELDYANDFERPMYQGQAVERLRARGLAIVPAVLAWVEKNGRKKVAAFFVEFLAEVRDDRISTLLADLVNDRPFEWRPAAIASLAAHARAADRDLFRKMLDDPLWGVRAGAILGLEKIGDKDAVPEIRKRLDDEAYEVRARAARTLHAFGDESGLPVMVESLSIEITWFDTDYGVIAREDALAFLRGIAKDDFGYRAWESAEKRAATVRRWHEWMDARDAKWREKVPERARARDGEAEYVFGLELRSCQWGNFFLRLDSKGTLVLGCPGVRTYRLTDDQRARLGQAIRKLQGIDPTIPYGRGGCDFEQYFFPDGQKLWIGRDGRPKEGDAFVATVMDLLKAHIGESAATEYREKAETFRSQD